MIYINGIHVDLSNRDEKYQFAKVIKDYHKTIDELRYKHGESVLFMSIYRPRLDAVTKNRRPHKPITISYVSNISTKEDGAQKWVYSPEGATIKDGIATPTESCYIMKRGSSTFNLIEEAEFVYYLTKTGKFQRKKIFIYDENEKQDEVAAKREQEVKLSKAIYDEESPLNNMETIKEVARKWGVSGMDTMKINTIKNILYSKIEDAEKQKVNGITKNGLDAFLSDINQGAAVVVGGDIQLAIEKGLLSFNKVSNEWLLVVEEGQDPWSIMHVDGVDTPNSKEILARYLQRNVVDSERLSMVVSGNAKIVKGKIVEGAPVDVDIEIALLNAGNIMDEKDYALLQKAYGHHGLGKAIGVKRDILKKGLLEFFEAQPK